MVSIIQYKTGHYFIAPIIIYRAGDIILKLYVFIDLHKLEDKQTKYTLNIHLEKTIFRFRQICSQMQLLNYFISFSSLLTLNTFSTRKKSSSTQCKYLFSEAMRTGSSSFTLHSCKHRTYLGETIFFASLPRYFYNFFTRESVKYFITKIILKSL